MLQQHKRLSGRLALVDGSNGQSLGRYLNMSRYKETCFSPVMHTTKDGCQYTLCGEGVETVKGKSTNLSIVKKCGCYERFPFVGVIGDVGGDGKLDQVAIMGNQSETYSGTVYEVRIIKMNDFDAAKPMGRYRSKLNRYVSEEMRNLH